MAEGKTAAGADPYVKSVVVDDPELNAGAGPRRRPFPANTVHTTKYTPWNFIFKNLFVQFQKLANVYFLFVGVLEVVPEFTVSNSVPTYIGPLSFVLMVTAIKDILEDLARARADKEENGRKTQVFDADAKGFVEKKWSEVRTGDIVRLVNRDMIPADIVMLASSSEGGLVYVSTANLDGETNLKLRKIHADLNLVLDPRQAASALSEGLATRKSAAPTPRSRDDDDSDDDGNDGGAGSLPSVMDGCQALRGSRIDCELPNKNLNKFEATMYFSEACVASKFHRARGANASVSVPLSRENVVFRSCQLRNTIWMIGLVVSTGTDTKIQKNMSKNPFKTSRVMRDTNKIVAAAFLMMVIVSAVCAGMSHSAFSSSDYLNAGYLMPSGPAFSGNNTSGVSGASGEHPAIVQSVFRFFTFIIIFGNFVPISLYVSLDVVKFMQSMLINSDKEMYDAETDTPANVKSLDLNEELGMVDHVFSDKTGTLTCNKMEFMVSKLVAVRHQLSLPNIS